MLGGWLSELFAVLDLPFQQKEIPITSKTTSSTRIDMPLPFNPNHAQPAKSCSKGINAAHRVHHTITRKKAPIIGRVLDKFYSLPLFCRVAFVLGAVLWKFYVFYLLLTLLLNHTTSSSTFGTHDMGVIDKLRAESQSSVSLLDKFLHRSAPIADASPTVNDVFKREVQFESPQDAVAMSPPSSTSTKTDDEPLRVLHIVTALAEYNNGQRGTVRGSDRLQDVFIPILKDSVSTMIAKPYNYHVDVYLILGWKLAPERRKLIEDALPEGVGLEIWDDAIPLGYDRKKDTVMKPVTRGLARQHRFVIKDKLDSYDFFTVFEDDMRITGQHISHFLEITAALNELKEEAPETLPEEKAGDRTEKFYGPLSKTQLGRMIPGFIRVEVLLDESKWPSQADLGPIPVDLEFLNEENGTIEHHTFDPAPCCEVENIERLPSNIKPEQIMIWETAALGINVRKFPPSNSGEEQKSIKPTLDLDWMLLQPGPKVNREKYVGGYWSGRDGAFGDIIKPGGGTPYLIAQQGGWMATKEQLIDMHHNQCGGTFFPPFNEPSYHEDGLLLNNVEFWSGGFSLFSKGNVGCNMQRVISLKPEHFSKHFIYHTANNKQKKGIANDRLLKATNFYGEINSVVKAARDSMAKGQ